MIARILNFCVLVIGLVCLLSFGLSKINAQDASVYDWYIKSFDSTINVVSDQNVEITEKITADFLIPKHGIYRTIPYRYEDNRGQGRSIFLKFISITDENGLPYKYAENYSSGTLTCRIGDENLTLTGEKIYIIKYRLSNVLNYYDNFAELYFNVNGNGWDVPIKKISATAVLPKDQTPEEFKSYLGVYGEKNTSRVKIESGRPYKISAEDLEPKESLTIVSRWNEGLTPKPGARQKIYWFLSANGIYLLPALIFLLLLVLFLKYGHDPRGRGTIAPAFEPPKGLGVLEIGTIADEKVSDRDLTATIIDFAVRGFIKIREIAKKGVFGKKDFELKKIKNFSGNSDDEYIFDQLFLKNDNFKLSAAGKEGKLAKVKTETEKLKHHKLS